MTLGELIEALRSLPSEMVFVRGFHHAHSYRGYYEDLAFEPKGRVTVGEMLGEALRALGQTFRGYKGGDYTMHARTDVWIAEWGSTGRRIDSLGFTLGHDS